MCVSVCVCVGWSDWQRASGSSWCSSVPKEVRSGWPGPWEGEWRRSSLLALMFSLMLTDVLSVNVSLDLGFGRLWTKGSTQQAGTSTLSSSSKVNSFRNVFIITGLTSLFFFCPQQFFIALRLVACAQNGLEVALKSLNVAVPPPKFVSLLLCAINPHCACY